ARAVDTLIHIEAPSSVPGHISGGAVVHSMFTELASDVKYESSKELQDHANGLPAEALYLCPVDINPRNFKIFEDKIVALDFRAAYFLPESFIAYAMLNPPRNLAQKVTKHVNYRSRASSTQWQLPLITLICYRLRNDIGQPDDFRFT
ncbi:hypothetical protein IW261DRAFT_1349286, partial [Armillaria novae-zelandiae]